MRMYPRWILILLSMLLLGAWGQELPPVVKALAKELQAGLQSGQAADLDKHWDHDIFMTRISAAKQLPPPMLAMLGQDRNMLSKFADGLKVNLGGKIDVTFRKSTRDKEKGLRLMYRVIAPNGLNYIEFLVHPAPGGKAVVVDAYSFAAGGFVSKILADAMGSIADPSTASFSAAKAKQLKTMMAAQDQRGILTLFQGLSPTERSTKLVYAPALTASTMLGETEIHNAIMREFMARFPNDPSMLLLAMDFHFNNGDWAALEAGLQKLEQRVGRDPYLQIPRAQALVARGKVDEARTLLLKVLKADRSLFAAVRNLFDLAVALDDHKDAARWLGALKTQYNIEIPLQELQADDFYEAFLKSPEYAALLQAGGR